MYIYFLDICVCLYMNEYIYFFYYCQHAHFIRGFVFVTVTVIMPYIHTYIHILDTFHDNSARLLFLSFY